MDAGRHNNVCAQRNRNRRRGIATVNGFCLMGVVLVSLGWWSSYHTVTNIMIPVSSTRSFELHQQCGRMTVSFERYGGRGLFAPPSAPPPRWSLVSRHPIAPGTADVESPWFEYKTLGYALIGSGRRTPPWPGYFVTFPHALLVLLLALCPAVQLTRIAFRRVRMTTIPTV